MTRIKERYPGSLSGSGFPLRRGCRGLTLVELMISLVLSLLLAAAMVQLFIGNKQTFRMQEATARLQENGRFALEFITRDMRVAGYSGCVLDAENITNTLNDRDDSYLWGFSRAVQGFDGVVGADWSPSWKDADYADFDFDANPGPAAIAGTDIITLHTIEGLDLKGTQTGNITSNPGIATIDFTKDSGIKVGDIIFVTDCDKAAITQVTGGTEKKLEHKTGINDPKPGNSTATLSHVYADAEISRARAVTYFIANSSFSTDSNGAPRPALWRRTDPGTTEELVEGVEDMQILYGLADDVSKWGTVSRYLTADELETENAALPADDLWLRVAAVRIRLLVQTGNNIAEQEQTYRFNGNTVTAAEDDLRVRREFVTTVGLRNRIL